MLFDRLLGKKSTRRAFDKKKATSRQLYRRQLLAESLEERRVLAFATPVLYSAGSQAFLATGDLNNDGLLDIVGTPRIGSDINVFLNAGAGAFGPVVNYAAGASVIDVAVADFNGDNNLDIATANFNGGSTSILLGTGTGTFGVPLTIATGSGPQGVVAGDLNNDGKLDLVVSNRDSNTISVLLGHGTGTFGAPVSIAVGTNPVGLVVGHFDGDGNLDVATANNLSDNLSVLRGDGAGGFFAPQTFPAGPRPWGLAVADVNADGAADLIAASRTSNSVSVLLGTGMGTFGVASSYATGTFPYDVAVADFNGDGKLDIAATNNTSGSVSILSGSGTGVFGAPTNISVGSSPWGIVAGDFNNDSLVDFAAGLNFGGIAVVRNAGNFDTLRRPLANTNTVNVAQGGTYNAFFSDPVTGKVYFMPGYGEFAQGTQAYEYATLNDYVSNTNARVINLPVPYEGTYHAALNGHIYFAQYNTNTLVKVRTSDGALVTSAVLPTAGFHNTAPFNWGGFSDIDFYVDSGNILYVMWATDQFANIQLSRLNQITLAVEQTWSIPRSKLSTGWAFLADGTVYFGAHSSHTQFNAAYDLETDNYISYSNTFTSVGTNWIGQLYWDPTTNQLFAQSNGRSLVYPSAVVREPTDITLENGDLIISDVAYGGKDNKYTLSYDGTNYLIEDVNDNPLRLVGVAGATGSGTSSVTIPKTAIASGKKLIFNGGSGNDTLTVTAESLPFAHNITFNGGENAGDHDTLKVTGSTTVATASVTHTGAEAGNINLGGLGTITFSQIEPLIVDVPTTDLSITLPAGPTNTATLGDDGVAPWDLVNDVNKSALYGSTFEYTEFTNPTNSLTILRGSASDSLSVLDLVTSGMNAGLTIGSAAEPFGAAAFSGPVTLAFNKNLSVAATTVSFTTASADVAVSGAGTATLLADSVDLSVSGVSLTGAAEVTIAPLSGAYPISLGSETVSQLSLTATELNRITAGTLQIGDAASGPITVNAAITPTNTSTLKLVTGGSVTQSSGAAKTTVANLAISAGGAISMNPGFNQGNDVITFAAIGSSVSFGDETNGMAVGSVAGISGVTATTGGVSLRVDDGPLTINDAAVGVDVAGFTSVSLSLWEDAQLLTIASGASITAGASGVTLHAPKMDIQGTVVSGGNVNLYPSNNDDILLGPTTNTAVQTLELSDAELDLISLPAANLLSIGSGSLSGDITVSDALTLDAKKIRLTGNNLGVVEFAGGSITTTDSVDINRTIITDASGLDITANLLTQSGTVGSASNPLRTSLNRLSVQNASGIYVVEDTGVELSNSGLQTGGDISLVAGGLINLSASVAAGGSVDFTGTSLQLNSRSIAGDTINLTFDNASIASGTINGGTSVVTLAPLTPTRPISLGFEDGAKLSLTDTELDGITAGTLVIGDGNTGSIAFGGNVDRSASTNVTLVAGAGNNIAFGIYSLNAGPSGDISLTTSGAGAITTADNLGNDLVGDDVVLVAGSGGIGSTTNRIRIDANTVEASTSGNGGIYLQEANSVNVVGGGLNAGTGIVGLHGGTFALTSGAITASQLEVHGTLRLDAAGLIGDSVWLRLRGTGIFDLNNFSETIGNFTSESNTEVKLGSGTFTVNTTHGASSQGMLTGSGDWVVQGSGEFNVYGSSTYTGETTIAGPQFNAWNVNALGSAAGGTTVNSGFLLLGTSGQTFHETLVLTSLGGRGYGVLENYGGSNTWAGSITLNASSSIGTTFNGNNLTVTGPIDGIGGLQIRGQTGAKVTLSGNNSYGGLTSVTSGAVLLLGSANALGASSSGTTVDNGGTLDLAGFSTDDPLELRGVGVSGYNGALINSSITTATASGAVLLNDNTTIAGSGHMILSGVIDDGAGAFALTKIGSGVVTLTNANTYNGQTLVNAGELRINGSLSSTSAVTAQTAGAVGGTGTINNLLSGNNGGTIAPGTGGVGTLTVDRTGLQGLIMVSGSRFDAQIGGSSSYDKLAINGAVSIGGGRLDLSAVSYTPAAGDQYVLIENDGSDPILGTLVAGNGSSLTAGTNMPEGTVLSTNFLGSGLPAILTYQGGDGNDLVVLIGNTTVGLVAGNLVITDSIPAGKDDQITLSLVNVSGTDYIQIYDPVNYPAGAGLIQVDAHTVRVPLASITGSIQVNTLAGNDKLTVDYSGGTPIPAGGIGYDGGTQSSSPGDTLAIGGGSATSIIHTFTTSSSGTVDIDGNVITYTGLEPVLDTMTVADRVFTFTGGAEAVTLADDGVANNSLSVIDSPLAEITTFSNPTNSLTINLTNGTDTLTISGLDGREPVAVPYSAHLIINGDGDDTVTFASSTINVGAGNVDIGTTALQPIDAIAFNGGALQTTGTVTLQSAGAITTSTAAVDIYAANLVALAASGVTLDTAVTNLEASGGSGGVDIEDVDALIIGNIGSMVGVSATGGSISVVANGHLTVNEAVANSGGGSVNLTTNGTANYYPSGPQTNVSASSLVGWTEFYSAPYGQSGFPLATILASSTKPYWMMAARAVGSSTFVLLAAAPKSDVTFFTGDFNNITHNANGTEWYYSTSWSWGFALGGDTVSRNSADTSNVNPQYRMSWHTSGGTMSSGYRAGTLFLNGNYGYEKVLLHADSIGAPADIIINSSITSSGGNGNVTLSAADDILHNTSTVSAAGSGDVTYTAGTGTTDGEIAMAAGTQATSATGDISFTADTQIQLATVSTTGAGTISATTPQNIVLPSGANVSTVDGAITLSANQQVGPTSGAFVGVRLNNGVVQSTGSGSVTVLGRGGNAGASAYGVLVENGGDIIGGAGGTLTVTGTGGASASGTSYGVIVQGTGSTITSNGAPVSVTGTGGGAGGALNNHGVELESSGQITSGGGASITVTGAAGIGSGSFGFRANGGSVLAAAADITIIANSMDLLTAASVSTGASSSVTLRQLTGTTGIALGVADNVSTLGLTDSELDRVSAGTLIIGNGSTNGLQINAAITRPTATDVRLISGSFIAINPGSFDTAGGTLNFDATELQPASSGVDVTASTVSFDAGTDLAIFIGGTAVDTQYRQLRVVGEVDLTGADLVVSGSYIPVASNFFVIVNNDGIDPIIGEFNGRPEGYTFTNFLGSGLTAVLSYTGGDGNDVVISLDNVPPTVSATNPSFATSGAIASGGTSMAITFSEIVVGGGLAANYELRRQGADGILGNGDDVIIPIGASYAGTTGTLTFAGLAQGVYRLTVRDSISDLAGNNLDGNSDTVAGGDWVRDFVVTANSGGIAFSSPTVLTTGQSNTSPTAAADFNGDGWMDVAAVNIGSSTLSVFLSNGVGGFLTPVTYSAPGASTYAGIAVGNVTGNARPDIVLGVNSSVLVFTNTGAGAFTSTSVNSGLSGSNWSVAIGDMNKDGFNDIVSATVGSLSVIRSNGAGGFVAPLTVAAPGGNIYPISLADYNRDTNLDVFIPRWNANVAYVFNGSPSGALTLSSTYSATSTPFSGAQGDFNNDGWVDALTVNYGTNTVDAYLGNAGGTLTRVTSTFGGPTTNAYSVATADFDSDGTLDLVVGNVSGSNVSVLKGVGNGTFTFVGSFATGGSGHWVNATAVADFNNDGRPDIAVGNQSPASVGILYNQSASGVVLLTPNGFRMDIDHEAFGTGQLIHDNGAFDGLGRLQVGGTDFAPPAAAPVFTDGGRTLVTPTQTLSGLNVFREVTVPNTGAQDFARTIDYFTNPTGSPITTAVKIVGNLGTDGSTTVFKTLNADGTFDAIVDNDDRWIGTDDADGTGNAALIHYVRGIAGLQPVSTQLVGDNITWTYNLTVQPGETIPLAHFTIMGATRAIVESSAATLIGVAGFGGQAAAFLSPTEQVSIQNFLFGKTLIEVDGTGNLVVSDIWPGGKNDNLQVSFDGTNYTFKDLNGDLIASFVGTGSGTDTVIVPKTVIGAGKKILVNTLDGNDLVTVDTSTATLFEHDLDYDGGNPTSGSGDTLKLAGTVSTSLHTFSSVSSGNVRLNGTRTISYTGLEPVLDNMSVTDRVFDFTGAGETITVTTSAIVGYDNRIDSTLGESVDFVNPSGSLEIKTTGGSGADTVTITSIAPTYRAATTITTGGDDFVNLNTSVTLGSATSSGSFTIVNAATATLGASINTDAATNAGNISITANLIQLSTPVTLDSDASGTDGSIVLVGPINLGANTLTHNAGSTNNSIAGAISGGGGLTKQGIGDLTLSGTNSYLGATAVNAGALLVTGSTSASSAVAVNNTATLGGTGTIGGNVTVHSGGKITGGILGGVGTLSIGGNLSFNGGTLAADFNGDTSDKLVVAGVVDLQATASGAFSINSQSGVTTNANVFTLIDKTSGGAITDPPLTGAAESGSTTINGKTAYFTYAGGDGNNFTLSVLGDPTLNASGNLEVRRVTSSPIDNVQLLQGGAIVDSRPLASIAATYIVNASAGVDSLLVNYTNVAPASGYIPRNIEFNGSGDNDSIEIRGQAFTSINNAFTASASATITLTPTVGSVQTVSYTGVENALLNPASVATLAFSLPATADAAIFEDDAVAVGSRSRVRSTSGAPTFTTTDFNHATTALNVTGGSGDSVQLAFAETLGAANLSVTGVDSIGVGFASTSGNATLTATGAILELGSDTAADLTANHAALSASGAGIDIDTAIATLSASTTGNNADIRIDELDNISLTSISTTGDASDFRLYSTSGSIVQTGAVTITGLSANADVRTLAANQDITLQHAGNQLSGEVTLQTSGATGDARIVDSLGALVLSNISIGGLLDVRSTGGNIEQTLTAFVVGGASRFETTQSNADILLATQPTNNFVGPVAVFTVGATGDVFLRDANAIILDTSNVGGDLTVVSGAAAGHNITDTSTAAIVVGDTSSFTAGAANVILDSNASDYNIVGVVSSANTQIVDVNSLALNLLSATTQVLLQVGAGGSGAITDNNGGGLNVAAAEVAFDSKNGIGTSADPIDTDVDRLAATNANSGDIVVVNSSTPTLTIDTVAGYIGVKNFGVNGEVDITSNGSILVAANSRATSDFTLTTGETGSLTGENISVNAGVTMESVSGDILLEAGDNYSIPVGAVLKALAGTVTLQSIDGATGVGSTFFFEGDIEATHAYFLAAAGGNPGEDTFNMRPDNLGAVKTPIDIHGQLPVVAPGDVLNLDTSLLMTMPTLTLGPGANSGTWDFNGLAGVLKYQSIETVNSTGDYNLVLDMPTYGPGSLIQLDLINTQTQLRVRVDGSPVFVGNDNQVNSFTLIGANTTGETFQILADAQNYLPTEGGGFAANSPMPSPRKSASQAMIDSGRGPSLAEIYFDGGSGANDKLEVVLGMSRDVAYFSDAQGGFGDNAGDVSVAPAGVGRPGMFATFATLEDLQLTGSGGPLLVDASSTPNNSLLTINNTGGASDGVSQITGNNGVANTTFSGFNSLYVSAGGNSDSVNLVAIDGGGANPLTSVTLDGSNTSTLRTDTGDDTLRIQSLPATVNALVLGGYGSDTILLYNDANTVDNIAGPVVVNGENNLSGTNNDILAVVDFGDTSGDTVVITKTTVEGLTGYSGTDVTYSNIDTLDVTTTSGIDGITVNMPPGASDLESVSVRGGKGRDNFDVTAVEGFGNLYLYGNGPFIYGAGSLTDHTPDDAGDAALGDLFGATSRIQPSLSTVINIFGGAPTFVQGPGNIAGGDKLRLDMAFGGSPTAPVTATSKIPVLIDTIGVNDMGVASSASHQKIFFTEIDDFDVTDKGYQTNVQRGDLFVRATDSADKVTLYNDASFATTGKVRLRYNVTDIGPFFQTNSSVTSPGKWIVYGQGGNDQLTVNNTLIRNTEMFGQGGNDYLTASTKGGNDVLVGGSGADRVQGFKGNDVLWGDKRTQDPTISGDEAPESPFDLAADGADTINGGDDNDLIDAGGGNDKAYGENGDDIVRGGLGDDTLGGARGFDIVIGGGGKDKINGGYDRDFLIGGDGVDTVDGDQEQDIVIGDKSLTWEDNTQANDAALVALLFGVPMSGNDYWKDTSLTYQQRTTSTYLQSQIMANIQDDGVMDTLVGDTDLDWYFDAFGVAPGTGVDKYSGKTTAEKLN